MPLMQILLNTNVIFIHRRIYRANY